MIWFSGDPHRNRDRIMGMMTMEENIGGYEQAYSLKHVVSQPYPCLKAMLGCVIYIFDIYYPKYMH